MKMNALCLFFLLFLSAFAAAEAAAPDGDSSTDTDIGADAGVSTLSEDELAMQDLHDAGEDTAEEAKQLLIDLGVFDADTCEPGTLLDFVLPAALILLIVATGLAIFYMAGTFFQSPQLIAMSKQEFYELIHTVLIVVLFFAFYAFAQSVLGLSGFGPDDIYAGAMNYSMLMVQKITTDIFWLSAFNTLLYMIYNAPLRMGGALHMAIHFNLGGILKPMVDGVGTMASLLSFALGEWIVHIILLCYIKRYALTFFLPLGILLKSLPQTRGGGNALIALSIAFFLIYPLMLVMNYEAYTYKYGQLAERSGVESIISDFLWQSGLGSTALYAFFMKGMLKTIPGMLALSWGITVFFDLYADVVYTVFVLSIFLPLLNIFVTFTFARELSKYFGTEINIAGFVKMI